MEYTNVDDHPGVIKCDRKFRLYDEPEKKHYFHEFTEFRGRGQPPRTLGCSGDVFIDEMDKRLYAREKALWRMWKGPGSQLQHPYFPDTRFLWVHRNTVEWVSKKMMQKVKLIAPANELVQRLVEQRTQGAGNLKRKGAGLDTKRGKKGRLSNIEAPVGEKETKAQLSESISAPLPRARAYDDQPQPIQSTSSYFSASLCRSSSTSAPDSLFDELQNDDGLNVDPPQTRASAAFPVDDSTLERLRQLEQENSRLRSRNAEIERQREDAEKEREMFRRLYNEDARGRPGVTSLNIPEPELPLATESPVVHPTPRTDAHTSPPQLHSPPPTPVMSVDPEGLPSMDTDGDTDVKPKVEDNVPMLSPVTSSEVIDLTLDDDDDEPAESSNAASSKASTSGVVPHNPDDDDDDIVMIDAQEFRASTRSIRKARSQRPSVGAVVAVKTEVKAEMEDGVGVCTGLDYPQIEDDEPPGNSSAQDSDLRLVVSSSAVPENVQVKSEPEVPEIDLSGHKIQQKHLVAFFGRTCVNISSSDLFCVHCFGKKKTITFKCTAMLAMVHHAEDFHPEYCQRVAGWNDEKLERVRMAIATAKNHRIAG